MLSDEADVAGMLDNIVDEVKVILFEFFVWFDLFNMERNGAAFSSLGKLNMTLFLKLAPFY